MKPEIIDVLVIWLVIIWENVGDLHGAISGDVDQIFISIIFQCDGFVRSMISGLNCEHYCGWYKGLISHFDSQFCVW